MFKVIQIFRFSEQISMIASKTRATTEQLAKTHWLITSARVL